MTIKVFQFYEAVNNRISSGSPFLWDCYGPDCRIIEAVMDDAMNDDRLGAADAIIDKLGYVRELRFRFGGTEIVWFDPDFREAAESERIARQVERDFEITELSGEEFLQTIKNVFLPDDGKVDFEFEIDEELLLMLAMCAHRKNVTLARLIEIILENEIKRLSEADAASEKEE